MKRLFLAIPVTLFDYKNLQDGFENIVQGRWVPEQNLHLTLHFFADRYEKNFLIKFLSSLKLQLKSSELKSLSLLKHSKILYAQTDNSSIHILHTQIQKALMLPPEPEFIPHVTLMRIKRVLDPTLFEQKLKSYDTEIIGTVHPKIQLIQSILTPTGAEYTLIKEFKTHPTNTDI